MLGSADGSNGKLMRFAKASADWFQQVSVRHKGWAHAMAIRDEERKKRSTSVAVLRCQY